MRAVSAAYWELADQQQELERELAALVKRDGSPRGIEFLGWKSAARRRFEEVSGELASVSAECAAWQQQYREAMQQRVATRQWDKAAGIDEDGKLLLSSDEVHVAPVNLAAIRSRISRMAGDADMRIAARVLKKSL